MGLREKFACEQGFLLLEHLITLAIMGIVSLAVMPLMQVMVGYTSNQNALTMHEANTMGLRIKNEVRLADAVTGSDGVLRAVFADRGEVVTFFIQNENLVRRVNGSGGEILVYNVKQMNVLDFGNDSVRIILISGDGLQFSFYVYRLQLELDFSVYQEAKYDAGY